MGLKALFDQHTQRNKAQERAREVTDRERYEIQALPLMNALMAQINEDPDIGATFRIAGQDGGYFVRHDSQYHWAFMVDFHNKSDNAPLGSAPLRLAGNVPEYTEYPRHANISTYEGRAATIAYLVGTAANNPTQPNAGQPQSPPKPDKGLKI